jgi:hypothetical protein
MSWGDTFKATAGAASEAARAEATQALASLAQARAAVAQTAANAFGTAQEWVGNAVDTGLQWTGEAVNTAVGLTVYAGAAAARKAKELYQSVASVFGGEEGPPGSPGQVVTACGGSGGGGTSGIDIHTRSYREGLVNSQFQGADSPQLTEAMHQLDQAKSQEEVDASLATIAELRQRPLPEIQAEYQQYLGLKEDIARKVDDGAEPIDALKPAQHDFMGSTWQLRYGKVVGDQFGVDPVFGAMLNPTGGLVGPGNKGVAPDGPLMPEAVAYHGAYHDAMGHLSTYFDTGPGYNYMGSPIGLDTANPMAGQATGIAEWEVLLLRGGP